MSRLPGESRRRFLRKVEGATERMTGKKGTRQADIAFAMYDPKDTRPQLAENWVYIDAEYETFGYL